VSVFLHSLKVIVRLVVLLHSIFEVIWLDWIYESLISCQLSTALSCSVSLSSNLLVSGWKGINRISSVHFDTSSFSKNFHLSWTWGLWTFISVAKRSIHGWVLSFSRHVGPQLEVSAIHIQFLGVCRLWSCRCNSLYVTSWKFCCARSHRGRLPKDEMSCSKVVWSYLSLVFCRVSCFECLGLTHRLL
jgi:hypothetical protein